jgi:hypothetical protein
MTRLREIVRQGGRVGGGCSARLLGPQLCSGLRSLALAPVRTAAGACLAGLTSLALLPGQALQQVPACPELRLLELWGGAPLDGLAQALWELHRLQVRACRAARAWCWP